MNFVNDTELRALKPGPAHYDVKDAKTRNLVLRVAPKNAKGESRRTWCLVIRLPGAKNAGRYALGEYPDMTLKDARALADDWRTTIRDGIDPRKAKAGDDRRFATVAEDYMARHLKGQRRGDEAQKEIRRELLPVWKDRQIGDITKSDVVALVEKIVDRPAPAQAHIVFGHIRTLFNWAIERGRWGIESSPCDRLKPARLIGAKKPRQRVLGDVELAALWRTTRRIGQPYGPLVRVLMLTGQRLSEVAEARWSEFPPALVKLLRERKDGAPIDWTKVKQDLKLWEIPPERFKSDATHLVPLSDDVLRVLEELPHYAEGDFLFSTTLGEKPVNGFSKAKSRLDREMLRSLKAYSRKQGLKPEGVALAGWVLHDIRRTVRTRLSALRVAETVAEMVIGHGRKGLARVYDQHQFTTEMREALTLWAGRLRDIVDPPPIAGNVLSMKVSANG